MTNLLNCRKRQLILVSSLLLLVGACVSPAKQAINANVTTNSTTNGTSTLHKIFDAEWQHRMTENPMLGYRYKSRNNKEHKLVPGFIDLSKPAIAKRHAFYKQLLNQLNQVDEQQLNLNEQINKQIFEDYLENQIALIEFEDYLIPFNSDSGFYTYFPRSYRQFSFKSVSDYQDYLTLLGAWPTHVAQQIDLMREGLAKGMSQPKVIAEQLPSQLKRIANVPVTQSSFYKPFTQFPTSITLNEQKHLQAQAQQVIEQQVLAEYQRLAGFFENEYIPGAKSSLAAKDLPNGMAYYQQRLNHFSTLNLSAQAIHNIGLQEVKRIRSEMHDIIRKLDFKGSLADFIDHLRTDERFYAKNAKQLLAEASYIAKRMDGQLPKLFKTLPRLPYTLAAVPDAIAPGYTTGRYVPAASDTEPGTYWVNTHNLASRPLYNLTALTLHEAVPGHHLQYALNSELPEQPKFRTSLYISAFGEGWALYSEWLGLEVGFYQDPYTNFGRLSYEMWRAVRLVVDTGIHALGWSREQAQQYLASNSALSLENVRSEIDRYISWPGQAVSYKIGEIMIKKLRAKAELKLAEQFDVREFHEVILAKGAVPLGILEQQVDAYIAAKLKGNKASE